MLNAKTIIIILKKDLINTIAKIFDVTIDKQVSDPISEEIKCLELLTL